MVFRFTFTIFDANVTGKDDAKATYRSSFSRSLKTYLACYYHCTLMIYTINLLSNRSRSAAKDSQDCHDKALQDWVTFMSQPYKVEVELGLRLMLSLS